IEFIEALSVCREQGHEHFVRGGTRSGLLGSAGWHSALHKVGFVSATNAIDRVVDRGVENGESTRGFGRRRSASANGVERGGVPLGDYVGVDHRPNTQSGGQDE